MPLGGGRGSVGDSSLFFSCYHSLPFLTFFYRDFCAIPVLTSNQFRSPSTGRWLTNRTQLRLSSLFHGDLLPGAFATECNSEIPTILAKCRSNIQNVVVTRNVVVMLITNQIVEAITHLRRLRIVHC